MKEAIGDGRLPGGTQLLPHRTLAYKLGISVHTVGKAYDELKRQNLVDGQIGRGTYVLDPNLSSSQPFLMERDSQEIIDLSISRPLYDTLHVDLIQQSLQSLPDSLSHETYLACLPNIGLPAHREAGVQWLARCGLETVPNSIIMTNGVCHGMATALSAIARPGEVIVTDMTAHHLIVSLCAYLGYRLQGLEMDEEGATPDAFEAACVQQNVKVFFSVPTAANPMVNIASEDRRRALVAIARKHDVTIIEDDAWGPLISNRPPPIASIAPERTIYLTSFTKCTLPGMRAGYLVAPDNLLPVITGRLIVFSWMATPLISELASRWIEDGTADQLVSWQQKALSERLQITQDEMAGLTWQGHPNSLHFWLQLPGEWDVGTLVEHACAIGVAVAPTRPFMTPNSPPINAVRIAVGGTQGATRFRQGLIRLRDLLKRAPEPLLHSL
jgi:DNA-binding transcriptional MocR family regulator